MATAAAPAPAAPAAGPAPVPLPALPGVAFEDFKDESSLSSIIALVERDLSEPYSCFTYRYFIQGFVG